MKIHQVRNATLVVEAAGRRILVDPMLGRAKSLPPFAFLKFSPRWNPLVELPSHTDRLLESLDACLITHSQAYHLRPLQHMDHLDPAGEKFLRERSLPVACPEKDAGYLKRYGLSPEWECPPWTEISFLGGTLKAVPAVHGYGWIHRLMANGVGFVLRLPQEPSLYISGDTVLAEDVRRVLIEERPDIAVVAAGRAQLDIGKPLLMDLDDILEFAQLSPGIVIANHLEALNHCPVSREDLRKELEARELSNKVLIPGDGECLDFEGSGR